MLWGKPVVIKSASADAVENAACLADMIARGLLRTQIDKEDLKAFYGTGEERPMGVLRNCGVSV